MKEFKVQITHIFSHEKNVPSLSTRYLQITQGTQRSEHQVKINQAQGFCFSIEAEQFIQIRFSLHQKINGVVLQKGQGNFLINVEEIQKEIVKKQLIIYSIDENQELLTIQLAITQDLQNVGYSDMEILSYPESRVSHILSENPPASEPNLTTQSRIPKQISPIKKRHQGYKIRKKDKNVSIVNEIKQNSCDVLQNMKLDLDEAISEIRIVDGKGFIATIDFQTNPSCQDLKNIQIKIPDNSTQLKLSIIKMDGQIYNSCLKLPKLRQFQSLRLENIIQNIEHEKIGKLLLNYKKQQKVQQYLIPKADRLPMGQEIPQDNSVTHGGITERFRNKLLPQQGKYNSVSIKKTDPIFALKLNQKRTTKMESNVISECILPQIRKVSCYTQQGESQLGSITQLKNPNRYKTLPIDLDSSPYSQDRRHTSLGRTIGRRNSSKIDIKYISIKFHPSYLKANDIHPRRQFYRQKYLDIFFLRSQVYRSKNAIGGQYLNWELNDCKFHVSEEDTLTLELNDNQYRTFIGQFRISFNQLKHNYSRTDFLTGDLSDGQASIGKIKIQFVLNDQPIQYYQGRNTEIGTRRRATTIRKVIPTVITQMQEIPSESNSRRNRHYCQQIQQRNRRPTKSTRKKRKVKGY